MDERAFSRVAEAYAGRLYAVAYRLLRNRADAEDAVQRALMKAFAARASYSPRWAVSTWLYRVLSNVCIDELRRRRPPPEPAPGHGGRAADGVERADLALARVRGISVNTVKSQLARGKAILRRALEN